MSVSGCSREWMPEGTSFKFRFVGAGVGKGVFHLSFAAFGVGIGEEVFRFNFVVAVVVLVSGCSWE